MENKDGTSAEEFGRSEARSELESSACSISKIFVGFATFTITGFAITISWNAPVELRKLQEIMEMRGDDFLW